VENLANPGTPEILIEAVAAELSAGIESALTFWMGQIQDVLADPHLTTLGRMYAIQAIVNRYNSACTTGVGPHGYAA
jgi:hypothetical protein